MIDKLRREQKEQNEKEAAERRAIRERYMSASPCKPKDYPGRVAQKKEDASFPDIQRIGNSGHTTREETKIESIIQEPKLKETVV